MTTENLDAPVQLPTNIDGVNIHLSYIRRDLEGISKKIDTMAGAFVPTSEFITYKKVIEDELKEKASKEEIDPLRKVVYGVVALVLTTVLTAVLYTVIKK